MDMCEPDSVLSPPMYKFQVLLKLSAVSPPYHWKAHLRAKMKHSTTCLPSNINQTLRFPPIPLAFQEASFPELSTLLQVHVFLLELFHHLSSTPVCLTLFYLPF